MKISLFFIILLFFISCKTDIELAMERGIQYYEWNRLEPAILEFKYIIHKLETKTKELKHKEINILSRAHYNLAISYAKKNWLKEAMIEAKEAFDLVPTNKNRKALDLIRNKNIEKNETKKLE